MRIFHRNGGTNRASDCFGTKQVDEVVCPQPNGSGDGNVRIKLGGCHTNIRTLCRQFALGAAHVRTATQKVGRDTDRNLDRRTGNRSVTEFVPKISRRCPTKDAEAVGRLPHRYFQGGDDGFRLSQIVLGLIHIKPGRGAFLEPGLRNAHCALLCFCVGAGQLEAVLQRPDFDIGDPNVSQECHENVVVVFDRGIQVCVGRFDSPPKSSPEIQFPSEVESRLPDTEGLSRSGLSYALCRLCSPVLAERLLGLRQQVPRGDSPFSAGFQHTKACGAERQILAMGVRDQRVKHRIVEGRPPLLIFAASVRMRMSALSIQSAATGAGGGPYWGPT